MRVKSRLNGSRMVTFENMHANEIMNAIRKTDKTISTDDMDMMIDRYLDDNNIHIDIDDNGCCVFQ